MNTFQFYSSYPRSCTLNMKDTNGLLTTDISLATHFSWILQINADRNNSDKNYFIRGVGFLGLGTFTFTTLSNYIAVMSGTFKLNINGNQILYNSSDNIPYDVSEQALQNSFQ